MVASTFGVGGAERVTAGVLDRLSRDRFETRLYFLRGAGPLGRALFDRGFEGVERLCKQPRDSRALGRLTRRFRDQRPHVVFCLDHHDAMLAGRIAGILSGAQASVVASHSTGLAGSDGSVRRNFRRSDRVMMEFTTRVVAVSESHARYLRAVEGIDGRRIAVIENGIDLGAWTPATAAARASARGELGLAAGEAVVAMVAALRPEKAHEALLDAMAVLRARGRRVRALVAGDGPRRAFLAERAAALGVADGVDFLGVRDDVARLLHASDILVLPSRAVVETLPLAVLEAMATGVPVIASAVGSVPEVVEEGVTGWLIPPADPLALARRIEHVLDEPAAAASLAARARERVSARYSIERTAALYTNLFEEVCAA
jgi:glycosyltransferase involved in cell wall biosynthesis